MFEALLNPLAIILSLCTSTGILLHETKIDKMASLTVLSTAPVSQISPEEGARKLESQPHTHVERVAADNAANELRRGHNPLATPRRDDRKYRTQGKLSRGVHMFDSYHLPELADNGQFAL